MAPTGPGLVAAYRRYNRRPALQHAHSANLAFQVATDGPESPTCHMSKQRQPPMALLVCIPPSDGPLTTSTSSSDNTDCLFVRLLLDNPG